MEKSFEVDKNFSDIQYIIGIDEVGRGPIAGPVAVCAFLCRPGFLDTLFLKNDKKNKKDLPLRDSKKLSKSQREKWHKYLSTKKEEGECDFAVSFVSSENIDKFGIVKCIQKALNESLVKVTSQEIPFVRSSDEGGRGARPSQKLSPASFRVFLDGGLHAPKEYINQVTIIKGDETHPVISLASIIAKVSRDRIMYRYAKEFPLYSFDKNMGYGTRSHYEAIKIHGQTKIHRRTFIH